MKIRYPTTPGNEDLKALLDGVYAVQVDSLKCKESRAMFLYQRGQERDTHSSINDLSQCPQHKRNMMAS